MLEVEVKVRGAHDAVRRRLDELDAESLGTVVQRDTYYDAPHRDFATTDEALRLRRESIPDEEHGETRVTYKGPLVDDTSKSRVEHETAVTDGETMDAILRELGFSPAAVVEKRRERFAYEGYTVTLDDVTDVGTFVEVEREALESELASAREGAYAVVRDLGLDPDEGIRTSYLGMLLDESE
jgi:adenylate cyclase class 2